MNIVKQESYDYLIVGAGLFGAVFAREATDLGMRCLVIDKRSEQGGNLYNSYVEGINVHKYGAHVFHTDSDRVWNYINRFATFNSYINSPLANYQGRLFNLPFNMNTFYQIWGVTTPSQAREKIAQQRAEYSHITTPKNLEEQALLLCGVDIYNYLIKGYSEKQWGRPATELPAFLIRRIPFRFTFNNNYFNDRYQGIPIGGYNPMIEALLDGVEVELNCNYFSNREHYNSLAKRVLYTGKIDEFFSMQFGELEYRSLLFESEVVDTDDYQGNAVINYTDKSVPYTRIIEHKHFESVTGDKSVITREYPHEFSLDNEPYYPLNDEKNSMLLTKYQSLASREESVLFGGRLAEYSYFDMDDTIEAALNLIEQEKFKTKLKSNK